MSVSMMQAVRNYCEENGLLSPGLDGIEPDLAQLLREILQSMTDSELSMLMADIDVFERTGVKSLRIDDVMKRIDVLARCSRIMPGL